MTRKDDKTEMLKVFVSYSRKDVEFADQLVPLLVDRGFEVLIDRHSVNPAENWKEKLGDLILSCDVVVFILSSNSAISEICQWEVSEAERLGKKLVPVTYYSVSHVTPPRQLSDLNYIHFWPNPAKPGSGFYSGSVELEVALRTDLNWIRESTRLSEQARRWQKRRSVDGGSALLLRDNVLLEALAWAKSAPGDAIVPDEVLELLDASKQYEQKRKAEAEANLAIREEAVKKAEIAARELEASLEAQSSLESKRRKATIYGLFAAIFLAILGGGALTYATIQELNASNLRSQLFAGAAIELAEENDARRAVLLALIGDPSATGTLASRLFKNEYPSAVSGLTKAATHYDFIGDADNAVDHVQDRLYFAVESSILVGSRDNSVTLLQHGDGAEPLTFLGHNDWVTSAAFYRDGDWFLTGSFDSTAKIWSPESSKPIQTLIGHTDAIVAVAVNPSGDLVLTGGLDQTAKLWDVDQGEELQSFSVGNNSPISVAFHPSKALVAFGMDNGEIFVWEIGESQPLKKINGHSGAVNFVAFHSDGVRLYSGSRDGTSSFWNFENSERQSTFSGYADAFFFSSFHPYEQRVLTPTLDMSAALYAAHFFILQDASAQVRLACNRLNSGFSSTQLKLDDQRELSILIGLSESEMNPCGF